MYVLLPRRQFQLTEHNPSFIAVESLIDMLWRVGMRERIEENEGGGSLRGTIVRGK